MIAIPAIDIVDGRLVRLSQGDFDRQTDYSLDPLDQAKSYAAAGLTHLHLVDLDAARTGKFTCLDLLQQISDKTKLSVDYGGGVRRADDIAILLDHGAAAVNIGSQSVRDPKWFLEMLVRYGPERIIWSADVKGQYLATQAWTTASALKLYDVLDDFATAGLKRVVCTDISRDGMMTGPSINLYREILQRFPQIHLVASGGISCIQDLEALRSEGLWGAVIGKAIYQGAIKISELC